MNKLTELIDLIKNDNDVIRYQQLEKIISEDESLSKAFKELLNTQKVMVKMEYEKSNELDTIKKEYQNKLEDIKSNIFIEEYLDLLEYINNDIQLITKIIEDEVFIDFVD